MLHSQLCVRSVACQPSLRHCPRHFWRCCRRRHRRRHSVEPARRNYAPTEAVRSDATHRAPECDRRCSDTPGRPCSRCWLSVRFGPKSQWWHTAADAAHCGPPRTRTRRPRRSSRSEWGTCECECIVPNYAGHARHFLPVRTHGTGRAPAR